MPAGPSLRGWYSEMFIVPVERWRATAEPIAERFGIPTNTILAIITRETGGNPRAVSSAGAVGLMQTRGSVIKTYNANAGTSWTPSDVLNSPSLGIEIGAWLYSLHYSRVGSAKNAWERFALADLAYCQGWQAFKNLVASAGQTLADLSWQALKDFAPSWGAPEHPWNHSRYVADQSTMTGSGPSGSAGPGPLAIVALAGAAALVVVLIVFLVSK